MNNLEKIELKQRYQYNPKGKFAKYGYLIHLSFDILVFNIMAFLHSSY